MILYNDKGLGWMLAERVLQPGKICGLALRGSVVGNLWLVVIFPHSFGASSLCIFFGKAMSLIAYGITVVCGVISTMPHSHLVFMVYLRQFFYLSFWYCKGVCKNPWWIYITPCLFLQYCNLIFLLIILSLRTICNRFSLFLLSVLFCVFLQFWKFLYIMWLWGL